MYQVLMFLSVVTVAGAVLVSCEEDSSSGFDRESQESPVGLNACERLAADFEAQQGVAVFHNGYNADGSCLLGRRDLEGDRK